ncbi:hypothetical protein DMB66_26695 [Actinoplanes sp. ATCC 53533]|nr:hypothetical protein [Actinoplanes sp. ATCC 53533]RSM59838.1 hypothetical protein DMB66_26695 [Actinoplanes sp. ATCC 53533]
MPSPGARWREPLQAIAGGLVFAVLLTWPTLRAPRTTIPGDLGDPTLQAWQMAWSGHALLRGPAQLWHSNAYFPERYTYAYTDTLLGYAATGLFGSGMEAAVLRYNIVYVLVHALAFVGAYALVRQVGANRVAAVVAGIAWAYAPWRLAHSGHLNVLSTGGIALCLAMLARGHGWSLRYGRRCGSDRPGWAFAGWLVAAWQISLGFAIGLPFAYFLLAACAVAAGAYGWSWWRRGERPAFGRRLLLADLAGAAVFGATTGLIGMVYFRVVALSPQARRDAGWIETYSPPLWGFVTAPADSWLWGLQSAPARDRLSWAPEMALLPGVTLTVLAIVGLFFSVFARRQRILLGLGVLGSGALGLGANVGAAGHPGYLTLAAVLPGWEALRAPGRLMVWTSLLLAILAAGAITMIADRLAGRPPPGGATIDEATPERSRTSARSGFRAVSAVLLFPLILVVLEGVNRTPHPVVPPAPAALAQAAEPLLVLPSDGLLELNIMLWSTDGFPRIANGLTHFEPASQKRIRTVTAAFPDPASVAFLRQIGIRSVVVLPDRLAGTPWEGVASRPVAGLGITREDIAGALVYRLG